MNSSFLSFKFLCNNLEVFSLHKLLGPFPVLIPPLSTNPAAQALVMKLALAKPQVKNVKTMMKKVFSLKNLLAAVVGKARNIC